MPFSVVVGVNARLYQQLSVTLLVLVVVAHVHVAHVVGSVRFLLQLQRPLPLLVLVMVKQRPSSMLMMFTVTSTLHRCKSAVLQRSSTRKL